MSGIRLIKSTFYNEEDTKNKLCSFIMGSKKLSMGSECKKFEENFSQFQQRKYSVFVTSGSSANLLLIQSLLNLGKLKKGDRVGVSSLTWSTNVMPLIQLGLSPVLIDCEIDTLNVSLRNIKEKKIDALFLTNALGFCSDIDKIEEYCKENDILFIEDNCESLGTRHKGKLLGNFGMASTFSFFVGHHLSTIEGGMICTDDLDLYESLLMSRIHGWSRQLSDSKKAELKTKHNVSDFYDNYAFYDLAFNVRPGEINGFIGNSQMPYIDKIINKREENFKKIHTVIKSNPDMVAMNIENLTTLSNFGMPLIFKNKELCKKYFLKFKAHDVEIRPLISGSIAHQPFFKKHVGISNESYPNAEFIHQNGFYCGNNPELTEEELNLISSLLEYSE